MVQLICAVVILVELPPARKSSPVRMSPGDGSPSTIPIIDPVTIKCSDVSLSVRMWQIGTTPVEVAIASLNSWGYNPFPAPIMPALLLGLRIAQVGGRGLVFSLKLLKSRDAFVELRFR